MNASTIDPIDFRCGHCGREIGSNQGYITDDNFCRAYVCPRCNQLSFLNLRSGRVVPGAPYGNEVEALPAVIGQLYKEARDSVQASAYTAAVLTCRKLLMHIAVEHGAAEGESFLRYVEHLAETGFVPPNGRPWVDHIRRRGNEANHEIVVMTQEDAIELVSFVEMLLKFIYEFPSRFPQSASATEQPTPTQAPIGIVEGVEGAPRGARHLKQPQPNRGPRGASVSALPKACPPHRGRARPRRLSRSSWNFRDGGPGVTVRR